MLQPSAASLASELAPPLRLAVAYAPAHARPLWAALLALDQRLARAALGGNEPMLGQLRLAWWRDRFREPASAWPEGEPLLAALARFDAERPVLEALVDGWEQLCGGEAGSFAQDRLADARAGAILALARAAGDRNRSEAADALARSWASADLARRLGEGDRRARGPAVALPRVLRPLLILADLADTGESPRGVRDFLRLVRLGMFGR